MSNIPAAPSATPPAAPVVPVTPASTPSPGNVARNVLPEGVKVDHGHNAEQFFKAHKEANSAAPDAGNGGPPVQPGAAPQPPVAPVVPAVPAPVEEPVAELVKGSLAAKLSAKNKPAAAPVAPVALTAGKNPEDEVKLDAKYSTEAHESFKKIKGITSGLRDQVISLSDENRQLKSQLEASKSAPSAVNGEETERLKAENKVLSDRLLLVDLREHPRFQSEFIQPQQGAIAAATELLTGAGVTGVDLDALLSKPRAEFGKAVSEMAQKLSAFDQTDFAENMRRAYTVKQQADAALSKSRETYGGLRNQSDAQQKQVFERTWGRAGGQVAEHIVELEAPTDASPDVRAEIETYNSAFKNLRTVAEQRAFGPATTEAVAENAIKSAAYDFHIQQAMPKLMKEFEGLLKLNNQLASELRAIRDRNPNRQISGAPTAAATAPLGGGGPDGAVSLDQLAKMSHAEAASVLAPRRIG